MESQVHLLVMEVKGTLTDRPSEMEEGNSWWEGNPHAVTRTREWARGRQKPSIALGEPQDWEAR